MMNEQDKINFLKFIESESFKTKAKKTVLTLIKTQEVFPEFFKGAGSHLFMMSFVRDKILSKYLDMEFVDAQGFDSILRMPEDNEIGLRVSIKVSSKIFPKRMNKGKTNKLIISNFRADTPEGVDEHMKAIEHDILLFFHNGVDRKVLGWVFYDDYINECNKTGTNLTAEIMFEKLHYIYDVDMCNIPSEISNIEISREVVGFITSYFDLKSW